MRAVAGPRRWVGVLILSVLAAGVLLLVSWLMSPPAALLQALSGRLPLATAGTVISPLMSGILGVGGGLLAARHDRQTDRRLRSLVVAGVCVCLLWMALVSTFWFMVQGELMTLLGPGPGGRAGVSVLNTLLIPSTIIVFGAAAVIALRVRTATRLVALEGHVLTAHGRGLPTTGLVLRRMLQRTMPAVLFVLIVEFLTLYAGSLAVQTVFTTPTVAAALPPLLPAESLPFVLSAALLCIIGVIVVGVALATNHWDEPTPPVQTATAVALPSMRFRSTDFLDIRELCLVPGATPQRGDPLSGISLTVSRGQSLAVVGDAKDGTSLLCLAIAGLLPPGFGRVTGSILFDGTELIGISERRLRQQRGHGIGFLASPDTFGLDPDIRIGTQLSRIAASWPTTSRARTQDPDLLAEVGVTDATAVLAAYPHQVSGVTAQRVLLAAALIREPRLLIADHPTRGLDAADEAGFLDLLHGLQQTRGFTVILASDRVSNVLRCDRVAVMHEGTIVEYASAQELVTTPQHPHSRHLLAAGPSAGPRTVGPGSVNPAAPTLEG